MVKVLHTSLLNITVFTFEVLPLGSYALMPAKPNPPFKTFLELFFFFGMDFTAAVLLLVMSTMS
jgi:hypothetical protein